MSSTTPDQAQQELPAAAKADEAPSEQVIPAKREREDDSDVQFISSQPIKKLRPTGGEETGDGGQMHGVPTSCRERGYCLPPQDTTLQGRPTSAMPLGLPSHIPPLDNRGASLPAIENFNFQPARSATLPRSPASAAVSPKQLPQPATSDTSQTALPYSTMPSSVPWSGLSSTTNIASGVSSTRRSNVLTNMDTTSDTSNGNTDSFTSAMSNAQTFDFLLPGSFSTGNLTPNLSNSRFGDMSPSVHAPMGLHMPPEAGRVSTQHHASQNTTPPGVTATLGSTKRPLAQAAALWAGQQPSPSVGNRSSATRGHPELQHPHPMRPPQISGLLSYGASLPQPTHLQSQPCPACLIAKQQGQRQGCDGVPHGQQPHGGPSYQNQPLHPSQPSVWTGNYGLQHQTPPSMSSTTNGNSLTNNTQNSSGTGNAPPPGYASSHAVHYGLHAVKSSALAGTVPPFGQGPLSTGAGTTSPGGHNNPGTETNRNFAQRYSANLLPPSIQPVLAQVENTNIIHGNALSRPAVPGPQFSSAHFPPAPATITSSTHQPKTTTLPQAQVPAHQPQDQPRPQYQHQHQPAAQQNHPQQATTQPSQEPHSHPQHHSTTTHLPRPPPLSALHQSITTATTHAANLASSRAKHASNLLVDVAELAGQIFPFDIVARQHGTLPWKVSEALAAVVQVPLLRCATDKRRAGPLGSARLKEYKEVRKGWREMVREWERDGDGSEDGEGESVLGDEIVVGERGGRGGQGGKSGGGQRNGSRGNVGKKEGKNADAQVDPRAPYQPGEPSALDAALLLPPLPMPDQMLRESFFSPGPSGLSGPPGPSAGPC